MTPQPSAELVFDTLYAFQRSAALKTAIELDVFTAVADGAETVTAIASRCEASERGIRMLCDYLATIGLLTKSEAAYQLSEVAAAFLNKRSPAYLGTTARFLLRPELKSNFENLTEAVRRGGVPASGDSSISDENPIWIEFARSMGPMMVPAAEAIADLVAGPPRPLRVLDIAAGHGLFGIKIAQRNSEAEITAVDWPGVVAVAREHAILAGVADRYHPLAGNAFSIDYPGDFDVALVTNFLHHFDQSTCIGFLRKVHAALRIGGRIVVLEFVPNADRVSPPVPARFALAMLAATPGGDAYTFAELRHQLEAAGFVGVSAHSLPTPETLVVADK
jgi:2-polyprenyl-3-methyl-5-hydroxy-6-metoxy-1,4-benzoquinol methylase